MAKNPKIQYFRTYLKNVIVQFEDYFDDKNASDYDEFFVDGRMDDGSDFGYTVEIVSKQSDGWTKINYKGKTAYIKSEFLE